MNIWESKDKFTAKSFHYKQCVTQGQCFSGVQRVLLQSFLFPLLYNSRGISVHAFEFSQAENLSAQHMG